MTLVLLLGLWLISQAPSAGLPASAGSAVLVNEGARLQATIRLPAIGKAPFPGVVLVHGSGRITGAGMRFLADRFLAMGFAVLAYDKRGVGESTGSYAGIGPANSVEMFGLLAGDALAGIQALKRRPDVDPLRLGLAGNSQAGWIIPLAASRSRDVRFQVILSGPAVSVGEEIAYSRLAGEDPGSIQGLTDAEIARRMRDFKGPHGYDPIATLQSLATPSIWILGERDRSVPMKETIAALERARAMGRPITFVVLPGTNHGLMNPVTGERPDFWPRIAGWLREQRII